MATTKTTTGSRARGAGAPEGGPAHDDFYRNLRAKVTAWANEKRIDASYRDYVLLVPDLFHFLTRLMMEPAAKVATRHKAWLGIAIAYVLSPIDFIPDAFFPLGLVDDLIVMVVVLDSILGAISPALVKKHWAGDQDLYAVVRESLQKADDWVGKGLFRRIRGYLAKQGLWSEGEQATATPPPVPSAPPTASEARKKTPSRRPAAKKTTKKTARKAASKKTASKKTTKRKVAKKKSTKTAAKKKSTKKSAKKTTTKRTIGPKKTGGTDS